jgi:hypothetical protein
MLLIILIQLGPIGKAAVTMFVVTAYRFRLAVFFEALLRHTKAVGVTACMLAHLCWFQSELTICSRVLVKMSTIDQVVKSPNRVCSPLLCILLCLAVILLSILSLNILSMCTVLFSCSNRPSITSKRNNKQNYAFLYFNLHCFK